MTPILNAGFQGYNEDEILNYIKKSIPKLFPKIAKAQASGYTSNQILKYLNSAMEKQNLPKGLTPNEIENLHQKKYDELGKKILGTAAIAIGSYGISKLLPSVFQKGSQLLSGALQQPPPGPTPMGNAPISPNPIRPPGAGGATVPPAQSVPSAQNIPTQAPSFSPLQSVQIINDMGIGSQIKSLQQAGNPPEAIAAAIGISLKPGQRKWLDEQIKAGSAKPLADMIQDYMSEPGQRIDAKQTLDQVTPEAKEFIKGQMDQGQEGTLPEMLDKFGKQKKDSPLMEQMDDDVSEMEDRMEPGQEVATPGGFFGKLKASRNGKSLVEIAGKIHQIATGDLISSPLPEKDLADLYEDLIGGIEKETGEEVSRNVNIAGYNPETNRLLYQPHAGGVYIYGEIPQDDADLLKKFLSTRKTTGQNFIGAWQEGTKSPIGAAMSALIKRLQSERGGKGKEYEEKFDIIYDALRPAIEAKRKKARKKK